MFINVALSPCQVARNSPADGFTQADCWIRNIELTFRRREKRGTRTECPSKQPREFVLMFS